MSNFCPNWCIFPRVCLKGCLAKFAHKSCLCVAKLLLLKHTYGKHFGVFCYHYTYQASKWKGNKPHPSWHDIRVIRKCLKVKTQLYRVQNVNILIQLFAVSKNQYRLILLDHITYWVIKSTWEHLKTRETVKQIWLIFINELFIYLCLSFVANFTILRFQNVKLLYCQPFRGYLLISWI